MHVEAASGLRYVAAVCFIDVLDMLPAHTIRGHRMLRWRALDVGGKAVTNAADVRKALTDARKEGKHSVLMRVKTAETTRFIALPIGKA